MAAAPPLVQKSSNPTATTTTSLVETVNINVDDFSETFLTCSTCLYTFDQDTRKPKLLPCSHSVCLFCLTQLASISANTEPQSLKCPLCRDVCVLPTGGVTSFPAAFFINQLLDVMQKQRKDVVPSCTSHPSDQLLYCETCDLVFCEQCQSSIINKKCNEHTVVPLSIAIKRMSEIVVYRAKGRLRALDAARITVSQEIEQLDENVDKIVEQINIAMQEVSNLVENRRRGLIETARVRRDEKRKVLKDQIEAIQDEKKKLEKELESCQVDVRAMARKLKNQEVDENWQRQIVEPRENAFLRINTNSSQMLLDVEKNLSEFGQLYASNTFPGTSTIDLKCHLSINIDNCVTLITRDVNGLQRSTGGDPVEVNLVSIPHTAVLSSDEEDNAENQVPTTHGVSVTDKGDGTYDMVFRVDQAGDYQLIVNIFGRPVKNSPLTVTVLKNHAPYWQLPVQLSHPTKVAISASKIFYVLDSGNSRVRVVKENGDVITDLSNDALKGGTAVGMVLLANEELAILNWSKKLLSRINIKNEVIQAVSFSEFDQPIDLVQDERGRFIIGDTRKVFVFDPQMRPLFSFPIKSLNDGRVNAVGVGLDGDILVGTTTEVLLYNSAGKKLRHIHAYPPRHNGRISVQSVNCCLQSGLIISGVTDKRTNRVSLAVCNYKGMFQYAIASPGPHKLSAPSGVLLSPPGYPPGTCFLADHNLNNVRMFKYK